MQCHCCISISCNWQEYIVYHLMTKLLLCFTWVLQLTWTGYNVFHQQFIGIGIVYEKSGPELVVGVSRCCGLTRDHVGQRLLPGSLAPHQSGSCSLSQVLSSIWGQWNGLAWTTSHQLQTIQITTYKFGKYCKPFMFRHHNLCCININTQCQ